MTRRTARLITGYAGAAVAVIIAWLVRWSLGHALGDQALYVTFVGAVLITTWVSGLGPGLAALVMSVVLIAYVFLPPTNSMRIAEPTQALGLALYVVAVSICIGVTETIRALHESRAAALRLSDERFRHLTEAVPSLVWTAAPDGSINYANEKWLQYCGPDAVRNAAGWPEMVCHPEDRVRCAEQWARSLHEGTEYEVEVRNRRFDGVHRWFVTRAVPWKTQTGRILGWFGISTDIHEQKEIEERLHEADRLKDEFLATLAHELRNPLAPMRNALEVMRRSDGDGTSTEGAREIMDRQLTHLVRLVDDLLDLSRITRGRIELRKSRLDVADALYDALETCRPQLESRRHRLSVRKPREPVLVDADRIRLAQVFTNLLSNASKYTPRGGDIEISVARDGDEAVVRLRDSGIGIPPENLPNIFDMFSQAVRSQELTDGGLGIGLSLVRGLMTQHGGVVEAKSEGMGRGSEFIVRLPVANGELSESAANESTAGPRMAVKRCILVADDNRDSADSLATMLSLMGHEAHAAYDGQDAIDKAFSHRPDVIVLDLGMPKIDGYEAARRIRNEPWSNGVFLVALTGWGQEEDRARAKEAGFDFHLTKPAHPETLVKLIASTVHGGSA